MYRYLILVWNALDAEQASTAATLARRAEDCGTGWRRVLRREGVAAYDAGRRPGISESRLFAEGAVATFGTVFRRKDETGFQNAPAVSQNPLSVAREFLHDYWGRYVALMIEAQTGRRLIARDASGMLPCYVVRRHGVLIVFSDLEDCIELGALPLTVDWEYVAASAANSALHSRATGLHEIQELLPGECIDISDGSSTRHLLWHPFSVAKSHPIEDASEAERELRSVAQFCVDAWAGLHPRILHCLSGGLDSSIVLACLARSAHRPIVTCLTYYTQTRDTDERPYARMAADASGVALIERELTSEIALQRLGEIRRSPRPGSYIAPLQRQRLEAAFASDVGSQAIFSGGGGDAVFFQGHAELALTDGLRRGQSFAPGFATALAAARITGRSVWSLLRRAIRDEWRSGRAATPHIDDSEPATLLGPAVLDIATVDPRWRHPWLEDCEHVPPGKRWHALSLAPPVGYYDSFDRTDDPERVYPLLSQPLVELCLRIPTDLMIIGGWDRAIARRAFAAELPAPIAQRRTKGGADRLGAQILRANLPFVRDLLLDGLLVRERVLDGKALERCLGSRSEATLIELNRILHEYLSLEAWVRRCSTLELPAAIAA